MMEEVKDTVLKFEHKGQLYFSRVYGEGIFALFAFTYSVYKVLQNGQILSLWLVILIVSIYSLNRLFISKSVPRQISVEGNRIVFSGLGSRREFAFSELEAFKIKEFTSSRTFYLRIKENKTHKFWIEFNAYSNSESLRETLLEIEERIHPDSLKAKIKANNNRYQKMKSGGVH